MTRVTTFEFDLIRTSEGQIFFGHARKRILRSDGIFDIFDLKKVRNLNFGQKQNHNPPFRVLSVLDWGTFLVFDR